YAGAASSSARPGSPSRRSQILRNRMRSSKSGLRRRGQFLMLIILGYQVAERLFTRRERRKMAEREGLESVDKGLRNTLRAHPGRAFHVRAVEHHAFFNDLKGSAVYVRAGEVNQDQDRIAGLGSYVTGNEFRVGCHLFRGAVAQVNEQDPLSLMRDEPDAIQ